MNEAEGRELAALPKWGEPGEWLQERPNTISNSFGVVDAEGKSIKGLEVWAEVFISPRLELPKFLLSLMRKELGRHERAYQLEINLRPGLRQTDHAYSHEHYGEQSYQADPSWASLSFEGAVKRFCEKANLTITPALPDYQDFALK